MPKLQKKYFSNSVPATKKLASFLARELVKKYSGKPIVLGLTGELGSSKTVFVQGFLSALGIKKGVLSPTFVILREYSIKDGKYARAYHADLYRLYMTRQEFNLLGLGKIFKEKNSIVLIEWAEKAKRFLPKNTIWIKFSHEGKNKRVIETVTSDM